MMFSLTPEELSVLQLSCKVAASCLVVSIIPAICVGWFLARKEFWGKSFIETLVFLPLVLPPVVPIICFYKFLAVAALLGNIWHRSELILHLTGKALFLLRQ